MATPGVEGTVDGNTGDGSLGAEAANRGAANMVAERGGIEIPAPDAPELEPNLVSPLPGIDFEALVRNAMQKVLPEMIFGISDSFPLRNLSANPLIISVEGLSSSFVFNALINDRESIDSPFILSGHTSL